MAACLLILFLLATSLASAASSSAANVSCDTTRIGLHLSDLHLDPFFGTDRAVAKEKRCRHADTPWFGVPGCDTSLGMMRSALQSAASALATTISQSPPAAQNATPVVYYTGDWLRHDMTDLADPVAIAIDIVGNITAEFNEAFNLTQFGGGGGGGGVRLIHHPVIPVSYGNEDFIPDYHFNVTNAGNVPFMHDMARAMQRAGIFTTASQVANFAYCGYAAHEVDPGALRAVALNTLIYTMQVNPTTTVADPCGQFAWLRLQLESARSSGEKVHILSHIPPALPFWKGSYFNMYKAMLIEFSDVVSAQFYGHIHRFGYMASANDAMAPLFLGGPITRISKTAPDFTVMPLGGAAGDVVLDRVQYVFENVTQVWAPLHSLRDVLSLPDLTTPSLRNASIAMLRGHDDTLFDRYYKMFQGGYATRSPDLADRLAIPCLSLAFDWADAFKECLSSATIGV
jgi:sphingomyelin phosphodiesterase acid-like 3